MCDGASHSHKHIDFLPAYRINWDHGFVECNCLKIVRRQSHLQRWKTTFLTFAFFFLIFFLHTGAGCCRFVNEVDINGDSVLIWKDSVEPISHRLSPMSITWSFEIVQNVFILLLGWLTEFRGTPLSTRSYSTIFHLCLWFTFFDAFSLSCDHSAACIMHNNFHIAIGNMRKKKSNSNVRNYGMYETYIQASRSIGNIETFSFRDFRRNFQQI